MSFFSFKYGDGVASQRGNHVPAVVLGRNPLNRFHLYCVLVAHGKKCMQPRANSFAAGFAGFSTSSKNQQTPPEWGA
jgi:hypothetical protein